MDLRIGLHAAPVQDICTSLRPDARPSLDNSHNEELREYK